MSRRSLRTHLFGAIGAVVVLAVGATLLLGSVLARRAVERATLRDVSHQADLLAERERVALLPFSRLPSLKPFLARQGERAAAQRLDRPTPYLTDTQRRVLGFGGHVDGTVRLHGTTYFMAARRVNAKAFILLRPKRLTPSASPYIQGLLFAGLAGIAVAALVALWLARRIARPIRRVAHATQSVAAGHTPEPVPADGPKELAALARAFNDMAAQLEQARAAERSFLLSVSHELKTPLTAIRGYAEGLADRALSADDAAATISLESARLERLVGDLLDLARLNKSEFSIRREPIDLADAAREAERRYAGQARDFGVRLETFVPGPAPAVGDADRVLQIASNLVENALRLTPPGGRVRILAAPGVLTVEDTGPGLKPEELGRAFERFYLHSRYGGERPVGTGLGLALVKELAEGMGGSVFVESRPGSTTSFVVRLGGPETFYEGFTQHEPAADRRREPFSPQTRQEVPT